MAQRLYIRRFVNRRGHHAGAYVLASDEDTSTREMDAHDWCDVVFTIADCGRQISLDFGVTPDELGNSLHKVDTLVDALTRLRAALVVEGGLAAARRTSARQP